MNKFPNLVFSDMPTMRPVGWERQYELLEPVCVRWAEVWFDPVPDTIGGLRGYSGEEITVPAGFIHNGPSIPDRLRGIVFYTHRLLRASIIHDYLYSGWGSAHGWARRDADRLFLESLKVEGVSLIRRRVMWLAVRIAGSRAWR